MDDKSKKRPEWVPENPSEAFTTRILEADEGGKSAGCRLSPAKSPAGQKRRKLTVDQYVEGVLAGDRMIIGRAITLVESNSPAHLQEGQEMLSRLLPHTEKSIRVGVTGYPGAGKSTFIEALGNHLCDRGHQVAVLAVDPSSSISRGSILGDKTRMAKLSQRETAFIRPSPSGGLLGGVARKSRETMLVCEAAGYDVILVETVGVGQSETLVRSMVDFFLLIMIAGAGDELQGIKRGIMELTDAVCINKADGDNKPKALAARSEFNRVLHYLQPATEGWETKAHACSSLTGEGISELWEIIQSFKSNTTASGVFANRRRSQTVDWVRTMVDEQIRQNFWNHPRVRQAAPDLEKAVAAGELPPTLAADRLLKITEE